MTCTVPRPLTIAEAIDRLRQIAFIRYCSQRDAQRAELGEPSPEEIGRREAQELIQTAREINSLPEP